MYVGTSDMLVDVDVGDCMAGDMVDGWLANHGYLMFEDMVTLVVNHD